VIILENQEVIRDSEDLDFLKWSFCPMDGYWFGYFAAVNKVATS
jgi:hypothetical protein